MNQPKRLENARILIANTSMDTDKIKVFGSKVRVDSTAKIAELELAEKVSKIDRCKPFVCFCLFVCLFVCCNIVVAVVTVACVVQEKMKDKVNLILKHNINCFINR